MIKHDWSKCKRETLERLMAAVDDFVKDGGFAGWQGPLAIELGSCLEMARAEAAPKLRTRAEVDAEIARIARQCVEREWEEDCIKPWDELTKLCREPLAPEIDLKEARDNAIHMQQEADRGLREDRSPGPSEPEQQLKEQFAGVLRGIDPRCPSATLIEDEQKRCGLR